MKKIDIICYVYLIVTVVTLCISGLSLIEPKRYTVLSFKDEQVYLADINRWVNTSDVYVGSYVKGSNFATLNAESQYCERHNKIYKDIMVITTIVLIIFSVVFVIYCIRQENK